MKAIILCCSLLLAGLTGCSVDWYGWETPAVITPVADLEVRSAWNLRVAAAAEEWNRALVAVGCEPPFSLGSGGHEVSLVPMAGWHLGIDTLGATWVDGRQNILVRATLEGYVPAGNTLMHELGHALGLDHSDDENSLMYYRVRVGLGKEDVANAAAVLGCSSP